MMPDDFSKAFWDRVWMCETIRDSGELVSEDWAKCRFVKARPAQREWIRRFRPTIGQIVSKEVDECRDRFCCSARSAL